MQRRWQRDDNSIQLGLAQHIRGATVRLSAAISQYGFGQRVPVAVGDRDKFHVAASLKQRQMYLPRDGAAPGDANAELLACQNDSAAGRAFGRKIGTASSASIRDHDRVAKLRRSRQRPRRNRRQAPA